MIIIALAHAVYLAPGSSIRRCERKGITGQPNSPRTSEAMDPKPIVEPGGGGGGGGGGYSHILPIQVPYFLD